MIQTEEDDLDLDNVNIEQLKQHLFRLNQQLTEEKSNSKQAAEYGLSLLEDFKKLQSKNYELEGEIETCKAELESTNLVSIKKILKLFKAKCKLLQLA